MSKSCSTSRVWIFIAGFFFLTTLTGSGYVIWKEVWKVKDHVERILNDFTFLFRTPEEQKQFEVRYFNASTQYKPVNRTVIAPDDCRTTCSRGNNTFPGKLVSGVYTILHACCETTIAFRSDEYMTNILNQPRKIAQFHGRKQYFKYEECSHVTNFYFGSCQQHYEYVTAVTEDEDASDDDDRKYVVEWVRVPGCCKCINTGNK